MRIHTQLDTLVRHSVAPLLTSALAKSIKMVLLK